MIIAIIIAISINTNSYNNSLRAVAVLPAVKANSRKSDLRAFTGALSGRGLMIAVSSQSAADYLEAPGRFGSWARRPPPR